MKFTPREKLEFRFYVDLIMIIHYQLRLRVRFMIEKPDADRELGMGRKGDVRG